MLALDDVSLEIRDGEFFVLLGPSGAGKTTTLRVIAGLERQDRGDVLIGGRLMNARTPPERDVAFVFQQYSLYPTMSVYDNLAFPLRSPLRRMPEAEVKTRVADVAEKLRIGHLLERKTARLSGGEMQRVSIGRAIVRDPQIYLMDEPLSNLDAKLRESLRIELKHLQKTRASTTLFVTHDQIEALTMADRIAVLRGGRIVQIGTPHDIYDRPATTFVAQLVGSPRINLCRRPRERLDPSRRQPDPLDTGTAGALPASFMLGVRPEDVQPRPDGPFTGRGGPDRAAGRRDAAAYPLGRANAGQHCARHDRSAHRQPGALCDRARAAAFLRAGRDSRGVIGLRTKHADRH